MLLKVCVRTSINRTISYTKLLLPLRRSIPLAKKQQQRQQKHITIHIHTFIYCTVLVMAALFAGVDIAGMLQSQGPVIKCVLLKANTKDHPDTKPIEPATNSNKRNILTHLIEQIDVDTTPKKSMVQQILGGTFTFLGQYEDEGIVLMIRNVDGEQEHSLQINSHVLQPPLQETIVWGDILVMKVAATNEDLSDDEEDEENDKELVKVPKSDEFFLDYTKADYIAFSERTDVVAPEPDKIEHEEDDEENSVEEEAEDSGEEEESNNKHEENKERDSDEEWDSDNGDDEGETRTAMMNLVMRQILRRFHEENGQGPNTQELLDLRSAVAEKMGVQVPDIVNTNWDEKAIKRKREEMETDANVLSSPYKSILTCRRTSNEDYNNEQPIAKRVKFGVEVEQGGNEQNTGECKKGSKDENEQISKNVQEIAKAENKR